MAVALGAVNPPKKKEEAKAGKPKKTKNSKAS